MRKVDGAVGIFHVACGSLHCLLPAGHDHYYVTDVMGINVGNVPQGLLRLEDDLMEGSEVAFFQIQDALGHLIESIAKVAQYLGLINGVHALRACPLFGTAVGVLLKLTGFSQVPSPYWALGNSEAGTKVVLSWVVMPRFWRCPSP